MNGSEEEEEDEEKKKKPGEEEEEPDHAEEYDEEHFEEVRSLEMCSARSKHPCVFVFESKLVCVCYC